MKHVLVVIVFCLLLSVALAFTVSDADNTVIEFDQSTSETFRVHASPTMTTIFRQISRLGGEALWLASLGGAVLLLTKRRYVDLLEGTVVIGGGKLLNLWLKDTFARTRPEWGGAMWGNIESFAFPSGHAMMSLIVYGYLAMVLWRLMPTRHAQLALAAGTVLLVGMIGLSRIILGRHYPSDIFAGYAMGGTWLSLSLAGRMVIRDIRARQGDTLINREEERVYETNRSVDQRR